MSRAQRKAELQARLVVQDEGDDGYRLIVLDGDPVGRLSLTIDGWLCEAFEEGKWWPQPSRHQSEQGEHAEGWAIEEIADWIAMREQAGA
jgi:hypothetical protein